MPHAHILINLHISHQYQWQIQDFPEAGALTPKLVLFCKSFAKNCMKMKEFGPPRERMSLVPLGSANEYLDQFLTDLLATYSTDIIFARQLKQGAAILKLPIIINILINS